MCGLTGFLHNKTDKGRSELHMIGRKMGDAISHRGPDSGDVWQDPDVPLVLSHRRLAIIDLSEEGHQPMRSESGRYVIAYNGEIYNYQLLQEELEYSGFHARGRSDTEIVLAAIEYWGLNLALQKMNGMFAFALWDRTERTLHLARDRLGKKPLYVGWTKNALVFGSELKALRAHPDFDPAMNREAAALYMRYGFVPAPHCIYQDAWALPAGFRLSINADNLRPDTDLAKRMVPFWHHLRVLETARQKMESAPAEFVTQEFEKLLTSCVVDRMISDVPLGAFLSGGIDSSSVAALMQASSGQKIKTYTIGFEESDFDEASYARRIAAHLDTDHHELYLKPHHAMEVIPMLPEIYDEPFGDISAIPTYLVSKFARQSVTVALSGDGGDEMLGGYRRHLQAAKLWRAVRLMPSPLRKIVSRTIRAVPPARLDALFKNRPHIGASLHKAASVLSLDMQEEIYARLTAQWDPPPVLQDGSLKLLRDDGEWQPHNMSFAEKMMYWDALTYLPDNILTKVDRASMAVSLEARAPLLDFRLYEFVWSLPESFKIRGGKGKYLLRQMLKNHLPEELFDRPKQGFSIPVDSWLRGPLKDWADSLLNERKMEYDGILNPALIRKFWDAHRAGQADNGSALWSILMFQAWREKWAS